ncbi:MAG: mechanosensitive ion channel [Betaproteobacteria bacterium]|nr:mechanosensitive ion channel [Betaproteobacteria bacterium]
MHRFARFAFAAFACLAALSTGAGAPDVPPAAAIADAPAATQAPPAPATPAGAASPAGGRVATLKVFNRTITEFRSSFLGFLPEERTRRGADALRDILAESGPGEIAVKTIPQGRAITVDGKLAFILQPADVNDLGSETLDSKADHAAKALKRVVEETREARNVERLLGAFVKVAIGTAIALAILWALRRVRGWIALSLAGLASRHAGRLLVGGQAVVGREQVFTGARALTAGIYWLLVAAIVYEWLGFAFIQFPWTRPWGEGLQDATLNLASSAATDVAGALPNLVVAAAIFMIAAVATRTSNRFFAPFVAGESQSGWLDRDTALPTRNLTAAALWIFALSMAYPYLPGAQSDAFKGLSVLVGVMISLGSTSIIGQGANGLILMYTRTIRPGEYVRIGEHEGTVVELGAFTTRIRTGLGEELTISNSLIAGAVTRNYSRAVKGVGFVLDTTVTIGYDAPWRQVQAMLVEAAKRTSGVLDNPAPVVFQTALADFYVEYRLVTQAVPTDPRPRAMVLAELHANIQDVFNEHGVQIMSPHYLGDPAEAKVVPPARWHLAPAPPKDPPRG